MERERVEQPGAPDSLAASCRPYPFAWNIIPFVAGLVDPLNGILTHVYEIFWHPKLPDDADSPERRRSGLVLVLSGIEGPSPYNFAMAQGVLQSGWPGAVRRFQWGAGLPYWRSIRNLMSRRHHERQSDQLAAAIVEQKRAHPEAPVHLLAQSGGCWIVLRALEKLPETARVGTAVLLCPSISPGRDPTAAASKCDGRLISVGGPGDFFFLGLGTTIFGTSDRVHTPAAGWVGWHHKPPRFIEARWHPDWARLGYWGNHISTSRVAFVREVVAKWFNA